MASKRSQIDLTVGFTDRLKEVIRVHFDGDVAEFAYRTSISQGGAYQILAGKTHPGMLALSRIANAASVSLDWLVMGRGVMSLASPEAVDLYEQEGA